MATPYGNIYSVFLQKVESYDLSALSSTDLDTTLQGYLKSSIPRFEFHCINDLTNRDDTQSQFNVDLGDDEIEILALFMILEYYFPRINSDTLLRQGFTNREWNMTSQANQLSGLLTTRDNIKKEVNDLVIQYSYNHTDLSGLT